ncbi:glutamine amidotransferase [Salmonella enterica subsp. enterica]|uniref:Glutamine amidotransferase n=1 Tax=Salmonella enterica I TaxID=59201 RepID=A0A3S4F1L3_SALET|nr:glutamine amidotransferase [Salmonella enterica subsp. enterica]
MPGLTDQATVLAESAGCPRQIVQYGNFVYGFQCHMEFTVEAVEGLIQHSQQELADAPREAFYPLGRRDARMGLPADE